MLCLNLMLEPTYLPTPFCGMKKELHMNSIRPIIEIIKKNDSYNDTRAISIKMNVKA